MRRSRNFEYITYQNLNITVDEVKRNENQYNDRVRKREVFMERKQIVKPSEENS